MLPSIAVRAMAPADVSPTEIAYIFLTMQGGAHSFCVFAGDAIKSVKPYFGLGVNTAFEDCVALDRYACDRRSRQTRRLFLLGF